MDSIFQSSVNRLVLDDERTETDDDGKLLPLGYPFEDVREHVLDKGRADFCVPYDDGSNEPLSCEDRVLLYCFVNLRKHFFASSKVFKRVPSVVRALLASKHRVFVDIGCGPATSYLALADANHGRRIDYVGIDCAKAMRTRARALIRAAKLQSVIRAESTTDFFESWDDLDPAAIAKQPNTCVILNFSYFFASKTLDKDTLDSLSEFVTALRANANIDRLYAVYTNSTFAGANTNYVQFMRRLGIDVKTKPPSQVDITYHQRWGRPETRQESFIYQVYRLKG